MRGAVNAALAAPALALLGVFLALPLLGTLPMAFVQWDGVRPVPAGWSLAPLRAAAGAPAFWSAVGRTFGYASAGAALVMSFAIPLALATSATRDRVVRRLALALLVPTALSGVASALLQQRTLFWAWEIFAPHLPRTLSDPLGTAASAFGVILAIDLWQSVGMCWLLLDGIFQRLAAPYGEVARMSGLAGWRLHLRVTLPLARDAVVAVGLLEFLHRLSAFDAIFVVTGGGPFFGTEVISLYVLRAVWGGQTDGSVDYGAGAAASALFLCAAALLVGLAWRRLRGAIRGA